MFSTTINIGFDQSANVYTVDCPDYPAMFHTEEQRERATAYADGLRRALVALFPQVDIHVRMI